MKANRAEECERSFLFIENAGPGGLQVRARRDRGSARRCGHTDGAGRAERTGTERCRFPCPHLGTSERDGEVLRGAGLRTFPIDSHASPSAGLNARMRPLEAALRRSFPAFPYVRVLLPHAFETFPSSKALSGARTELRESLEGTGEAQGHRQHPKSAGTIDSLETIFYRRAAINRDRSIAPCQSVNAPNGLLVPFARYAESMEQSDYCRDTLGIFGEGGRGKKNKKEK